MSTSFQKKRFDCFALEPSHTSSNRTQDLYVLPNGRALALRITHGIQNSFLGHTSRRLFVQYYQLKISSQVLTKRPYRYLKEQVSLKRLILKRYRVHVQHFDGSRYPPGEAVIKFVWLLFRFGGTQFRGTPAHDDQSCCEPNVETENTLVTFLHETVLLTLVALCDSVMILERIFFSVSIIHFRTSFFLPVWSQIVKLRTKMVWIELSNAPSLTSFSTHSFTATASRRVIAWNQAGWREHEILSSW